MIDRYSGDPIATIREQVARALINKGVRLVALDRSDEAIAVHDQVIDRDGDGPTPALRE